MEILVTAAIIGYIVYLRYYADLRTKAEQDVDNLQVGIKLYTNGQINDALAFFTQYLQKEPTSSIAYLYQARCYRAMGEFLMAMNALKRGESYDNSVADLHLEIGQILYEQGDYKKAFLELDKAVFYSKGDQADPYEWRGLSRQKLQQSDESQQDLQRASLLRESISTSGKLALSGSSVFFDRKLLSHALLIVVTSALLLVVIKKATVIHLPYLLATIAAASIGFLEPKKGWILAILQATTLWIAYTFFTTHPQTSGLRDLELFGLYGSIILTFVGSFIGGILKRQLVR